MRQCVGCRELKPKKDMIRVIKTAAEDEASSQIVLDATGRKNGRGAYVCPNSECLRAAIKNKGLERSLKMPIPRRCGSSLPDCLPARKLTLANWHFAGTAPGLQTLHIVLPACLLPADGRFAAADQKNFLPP